MAMVLEIPLSCNASAQAIEQLVRVLASSVSAFGKTCQGIDFMEDIERPVATAVVGLERAALEDILSAGSLNSKRIRVDGQEYARTTEANGQYRSRSGVLRVKRWLYRAVGERNGPSFDPVAARAGVAARGWLPGAASAAAFMVQEMPSRVASRMAEQLGLLPYCRTLIERNRSPPPLQKSQPACNGRS